MSYNDGSYGGGQQGGGGYGNQGGGGYGNQGGRDEYGGQQGGGGYGGGGRQEQSYGGGQQGGGDYNVGGGSQYNRPGGQGSGSYGQGGGDDDFSGAIHHAQQHSGGSGESSLFSNALGYLQGNKQNIANGDVDENQAVNAHQAMYGNQSGGGTHSSETVGAGAAMQALKMFTGGSGGGAMGGGGGGMGAGAQGGGGGQNQFIGMAMAQASKLFDQQSGAGNLAQGANKQSAVQSAGEMALKMYMKSQGGGMGGLMSKFM